MNKIKKIKFCKKCLYSENHPLGITFNDNGICSGCIIHNEKNTIDWIKKYNKLLKLVSKYKNKSKKNYDCIVPVSGAGDSFFTTYIVKKLGLNPLLVSYNKYFNTDIGIKNLANLRIKFDCDIIYQNINPQKIKKITRYTFSELGNIYWPILAGSTVFPVQVAIKYKIPLIIWGAHQGIEQVGMYSYDHEAEMTRRYRHDHDLFGFEEDDLLNLNNSLTERDIWQFKYPTDREIEQHGVRGIYLNNFVRWDSLMQHIDMVKKFGFLSTNFDRTFDIYDYSDCLNYMNLHDYLKLCKHGYSKVTDHATREIRFGRITRDQGIKLVKKYENIKPKNLHLFASWLGMNEKGLEFLINSHKNKNYWKEVDVNKWKFAGLSTHFKLNNNTKKITLNNFKKFYQNNHKTKNNKHYITFGKGFNNEI
jgi:N-acetyl sugar amidotransferase